MQIPDQTRAMLRAMEPLSAYGEYTDEAVLQAAQIKERQVFRPQNHLAGELSPYLKLHAADPVGWYTWGQEAFSIAQREDRPLFVNIGFYSEHWCRQMQRECFSDPEVAGMINDICIPVCVDREVRPDLNDIFMEACVVQNGSGGWPLNIFLTPEGRPFFCTTWLPKRTIGAMPGITEILPRVKWLWRVQNDVVHREADTLYASLQTRLEDMAGAGPKARRIKSLAPLAINDLRSIFDVQWGGWGGVPKFPEMVKLLFLLTQAGDKSSASKHDKSDAFSMTDITLRRMWRGGIHDHLGGGFSRYAVDERWLVPHFEKLLADQAVLLYAVSLAQLVSDSPFHRMFAEDIIFCSTKYFAQDASYSQGFRSSVCGDTVAGEGRYYLWTEDEIKHVLPEDMVGLFCAAYGVLPGGNFGSELGGTPIAQNILYEASTVRDLSRRYGVRERDVAGRLYEARRLLLEARDNRPLMCDDKVILGANGLMIAALSKASVVFNCPEWKDIAERCALFCVKNFRTKEGIYHRVWLDGQLSGRALAEDYAYLLWGIVELYKACVHAGAGEKQLTDWLNTAKSLAENFLATYWDEKRGGLILADTRDKFMFAQVKSCTDAYSLPAVNSISAIVLTELGIILEDKKYTNYARKIIDCFAGYARNNPLTCLTMITADMLFRPVKPKPIQPSAPVPTDEELNAEPIAPSIEEVKPTSTKPSRTEATKRRRRTTRSRER